MTSINSDFLRRVEPLRNLFAVSLSSISSSPGRTSYQRLLLASALIFFTATGVRFLHWHDMQTQIETGKMHFGMSDQYRSDARVLLSGQFDLFVKGPNPPANSEPMGHPPGYAVWLAALFQLFGDSITLWRFAQILLDAFTVLGVFFFARELLPFAVATIAGLLVAISPQVAYTSIVLLPDSLSVLPIIWAMFLIARCFKRPQLKLVALSGFLIGISCWFRANAMLLPLFLVPLILAFVPRVMRWRFAGALTAATIMVIAPVTIRNLIVFHAFVPLSLGSGIILYEGIADYDDQNRFGLLQKDHLVNEREAQIHNRPDYAHSLFGPDGVARERERTKSALAVIQQNPLWFAGVMGRRVRFMMTFEQTPVVSAVPAVNHTLASTSRVSPEWTKLPRDLLSADHRAAPYVRTADDGWLILEEVPAADAPLFISQAVSVVPRMDHILEVPIDITKGRFVIRLTDPDSRILFASAAVPDLFQGLPADRPPTNVLQIPFVSLDKERLVVSLHGVDGVPVSARLGPISLFQLGESSYTWTRVPRLILRTFQKFFTTRKMWVLILCGLAGMFLAGARRQALTILIVPLYYYVAHSPLHTEYRYVVVNHYFLLIFAAFAIYSTVTFLSRGAQLLRKANRSGA